MPAITQHKSSRRNKNGKEDSSKEESGKEEKIVCDTIEW
jgi:hypothetical protein